MKRAAAGNLGKWPAQVNEPGWIFVYHLLTGDGMEMLDHAVAALPMSGASRLRWV